MEYLIKSVYHFIAKNKDLSLVMEEILKFLAQEYVRKPRRLYARRSKI